MKLTDKRFWIWIFITALIPIIMSAFVTLVIESDFGISNHYDLELIFIWEMAYWVGGLLSYREILLESCIRSSLFCWVIVCPIIVILTVLWAEFRIQGGFQGLAFLCITCISWAFSILPLLFAIYLYNKKFLTK